MHGQPLALLPSGADAVAECVPVYETLPGWQESTVGVKSFDALPANARAYLRRIEALTGVPIAMVSTGPDRDGDDPAPSSVPLSPRARWGTRMPNLHVSWDQYNTLVERLALTSTNPASASTRSSASRAAACASATCCRGSTSNPLAILSTHSYAAEGGTIRGELVIAEHMTMTRPRLGDKVLLVDDMVDSGHTLAAVHAELPKRFPHITALRTAVLWWKACSVFKPDYLRRLPARQSVDPPAVRGLRHAASRRAARAARRPQHASAGR